MINRIKNLLIVLFLLCAATGWTQNLSMTANVNSTSLRLDDQLTLTVEIRGATGNILTPQLPSLPSFNVYAQEVEQSTVNNQTTTIFRYMMTPRFVGKAVIGPITFNYANKTYRTEPINITVYRSDSRPAPAAASTAAPGRTRPSAPAANTPAEKLPPVEASFVAQAAAHAGEDFFMAAAVENRQPYVNQTDTLVVRFYAAKAIYGESPYMAPTVTNLFMDDVGRSEGTSVLNGKMYNYNEFRYSISGVTPGEATVGPAMAKYLTGGIGLSILDHMFGAGAAGSEEIAKSNTIRLNIRPLPQAGKPASFYGAVGKGYGISATIDRNQMEAADAVNLTIKVQGPGNLKPTGDLKIPAINGFKIYDAATTSGTLPSNGSVRGYKTFKTVLVPTTPGGYIIPAIAWSYFNPDTNSYATIATKPLEVTVTPSTKSGAGYDFRPSAQTPQIGFQELAKDISYLKTGLFKQSANWLETAGKWGWLNVLFLLLLATAFGFSRVDKKTLAHKRALSRARNALKNADTAGAVEDAVSEYLRTKLKIHTASLQLRLILQLLKERGAKPAELQQFKELWQYLEAARFAPSAQADAAKAAQLATQLLSALDGELK